MADMDSELLEPPAASSSSYKLFMKQTVEKWDPETKRETSIGSVSETCLLRVKKDIGSLFSDPAPGICVLPDDEDMTKIHALITGPFDTPYEGGFFYFLLVCPDEYPLQPPRVKLMTTDHGRVRFNPNLYANGKVCLSILGTWSGPEWTPAQCISSVLISIQSLMNEQPYHNEPGFHTEHSPGDSAAYNHIITHETIRCAVCEVLECKTNMPFDLRLVAESSFLDYYDYYVAVCNKNINKTGEQMHDPFGDKRGLFDFKNLLVRLEAIKLKLESERVDNEDCEMSITNSS